MNFISEIDALEEHVELKYCERCGGLFLRVPGTNLVFCAGCAAKVAAEPDPADLLICLERRPARVNRGPKVRVRKLHGAAMPLNWQEFACEEAFSC